MKKQNRIREGKRKKKIQNHVQERTCVYGFICGGLKNLELGLGIEQNKTYPLRLVDGRGCFHGGSAEDHLP